MKSAKFLPILLMKSEVLVLFGKTKEISKEINNKLL